MTVNRYYRSSNMRNGKKKVSSLLLFYLFIIINISVSNVGAFNININSNIKSNSNSNIHRLSRSTSSRSTSTSSTSLNLIPLSSFEDPIHSTYLSSPDSFRICIDSNGCLRDNNDNDTTTNNNDYYTICIAEEDDLPSITTLTIDAFGGADVITLSNDFNNNLNTIEQKLLMPLAMPGINMWNSYANVVAFTDVLSGLRQRMKHRYGVSSVGEVSASTLNNIDSRIEAPKINNQCTQKDAEDIAAKSSLIIALARLPSNDDTSDNTSGSDSDSGNDDDKKIDVIATVELRLQPTDAKIPFSQPWFDKVERRIAQYIPQSKNDNNNNNKILQPYLSNLCVDENQRGKKIGIALCRVVECIARDSWKYENVYLHVDLDNISALNLYKKEGYVDVGRRWNPFWAGSSSDIAYYVKKL